ncbi:uncharacterized protein LOC121688489 isoform X2 [Alosa sapidissima]|uniref:uncharacterized protein LOC121688489 isoform X2 n=1 Tax=Alosa sapidissima TaxID=34773 RepID=UPI001C09395E|nr:uncharacterized protein LOC121688489 isoform X2 [Alosa sapidissima]
MDFYPRTIHQSGSWFGPEHPALSQRILPCVNTGEALIYSAPPSTATSVPTYPYVSGLGFPAALQRKECGDWCTVAQGVRSVTANVLLTSVPQKEVETITFVGNFPLQPTSVESSHLFPTRLAAAAPVRKESLTFVGNFTHSPDVTQDQFIALLNSAEAPVSGNAASHGATSTQKTLLNPTMPLSSNSGIMKHNHPSTTILRDQMPCSGYVAHGLPTNTKSSAVHYTTREAYVKMLEYHRHMASYYKQLKLKAEHSSQVEGSVCPQLQRKRGGVSGGSWEEPPQKRCWDDGTGGIILPDDAIEKLDAIPGVWDLAMEMGFLTVCKADD